MDSHSSVRLKGSGRIFVQVIKVAWRAYPTGLVFLIIAELAQGVAPVFAATLYKLLFDELANTFRTPSVQGVPNAVFELLILQALVLLASQSLRSINTFLNSELGRRVAVTMQSSIYHKVINIQGLAPFEDVRFSDNLHRIAGGAAHAGPTQLLRVLTETGRNTITMLSFLGIIVSFSPALAVLLCISVLPQLLIQVQQSGQRVRLSVEMGPKERSASYYNWLITSVNFAKEVRLFNLGDFFFKLWSRTYQDVQSARRRQQLRELRSQTALSAIGVLFSAGAFAAVILQGFSGHLSLGDIVLYVAAVENVQSALIASIAVMSNFGEAIAYYAHYEGLLQYPQPIAVEEDPAPIAPLRFGIEFRDVSFRYSEDQPYVLRDFNLLVNCGDSIAMVGLNGAGKTTLVKLLTRMYDPTEGQILWDGIDIRLFDPAELRSRIAAIFQDFGRYDLSVMENIGIGNVMKMDQVELIYTAAREAGIHDKISSLPDGYMTLLGPWLGRQSLGGDLSGGEWQKIALARMLLRPSDLLILDEPTAALDAKAEYDLYKRLVQMATGRTTLLITHRFSTTRIANKVVVIENGGIVEQGTHQELMHIGGAYAKLFEMQARHYR